MSRIIGLIAAVTLLLPVLIVSGLLFFAHFVQSPAYASRYFDGIAEIQQVEASRRWHWGVHPLGGRAFGCSFAIASLPDDAATEPPVLLRHRSHPWDWPTEWKDTPVVIKDGHHAALEDCAYALPRDLVTRLTTASEAPGSFYDADLEFLFLYSPEHRLIARIRFGD